jgi:transposase-like protein
MTDRSVKCPQCTSDEIVLEANADSVVDPETMNLCVEQVFRCSACGQSWGETFVCRVYPLGTELERTAN